MLPLSVDVGWRRPPWANWVILVVTVFVFFATSRSLMLDVDAWRPLILDGLGIGLITHVLLHGDLAHLVGNMLFLWVFGNAVCARVGSIVYPLLYVLFGLVSGCMHVLFGGGPAVGASGAINGVVGMFCILHPKDYVTVGSRFGIDHVPAWVLVFLWLILDVVGALRGGTGVGHIAHIAGLLCGGLTAILMINHGKIEPGPGPTLLDLNL